MKDNLEGINTLDELKKQAHAILMRLSDEELLELIEELQIDIKLP